MQKRHSSKLFTLEHLGSIVKIESPSHITVTSTGIKVEAIKVQPLPSVKAALPKQDEPIIESLEKSLEKELKKPARVYGSNPVSKQQRAKASILGFLSKQPLAKSSEIFQAVMTEHSDLTPRDIYNGASTINGLSKVDGVWRMES